MNRSKEGFTLIELVMVIAIIGIVAVLAVSKLSGYRENAKKELSIANMSRTANAIEVFLANGGKLSGLDTLVNSGYKAEQPSDTKYNFMTGNGVKGQNLGINSGLRKRFGEYMLSATDVAALQKYIGLTHAYSALWTGNTETEGEDGSAIDAALVSSPNACSCVAITNMTGMTCAVINPIPASGSDYTGAFLIYQACGQDMQFAQGGVLRVNGEDWSGYSYYATGKGAKSLVGSLPSNGGLLLAFGLGGRATCIGDNRAGIATAPTCPISASDEYSNYIILIRLRKVGQQAASEMVAEFAGIIDPLGQTRMLANWYRDVK